LQKTTQQQRHNKTNEPKPAGALKIVPAESRHATHILSNGDGMREQVMYHAVHEHEVHTRISIRAHAKVLIVVACEGHLQTVMVVHHAGDTIEAEAIELELIEPVARVAH
jgi:hypothetical protein